MTGMDAKLMMPAPNETGDCGDHNTSSITAAVEDVSVAMAKCTLLATVLVVVLIANALMLHDAYTSGQSRRWSASLWILKVCILYHAYRSTGVRISFYYLTTPRTSLRESRGPLSHRSAISIQ